VILCYITDRSQFPGPESARRKRLLQEIAEAARARVDYIQLREKDLPTSDLEELAREAMKILLATRNSPLATRLLINSRTDVALAAGAHGVHLRSDDISPRDVRAIVRLAARHSPLATRHFVVGVSCHTLDEVAHAAGADFALFGPVFEKDGKQSRSGLDLLRRACRKRIPVLALGGVALENAQTCLAAGAAGIAAIRLFQQNDIAGVVRRLRM
jgi:thiamine-phosphate pyrophosphorylase